MSPLRITPAGQAFIQGFEKCSLTSYQDQGGTWTIGWGCTHGVGPGMVITQDQADSNYQADLGIVEDLLSEALGEAASSVSGAQWDALVSFCYNVGFGRQASRSDHGRDGFRVLKNGDPSTMLRCLLVGDFLGAAAEFPKWDHIGRSVSGGLLRRRLAEQAYFLGNTLPP